MFRQVVAFVVAAGLLLAVVVLAGHAFAEGPMNEPPAPGGYHTPDSLIVGVPYEDAGGAQDAGVIDLISGRPGDGLMDYMNVYFSQTSESGAIEQNDRYGAAVAAGDFDHNGVYDIAIGVPGEDSAAGAIDVIYRFPDASSEQALYKESGIVTSTSAGDEFGAAVAVGDFNGDGIDDLAIGAPGRNNNDGAVFILFGDTEIGLQGESPRQFSGMDQSQFGAALAVADFDGDDIDDLAVGAPQADTSSLFLPNRSGLVRVIYGPLSSGMAFKHDWTQSGTGQGASEAGDEFGATLVAADFNGDGHPDLAMGAPGEDKGTTEDTGAVNILYNDGDDLSATGAQVWFVGMDREGDRSGDTLAAGDFNADGKDDLAIGTPYEDDLNVVPAMVDAGRVDVFFGTSHGVTNQGAVTFGPTNERFEALGYALVAGDFNGDKYADLVMGVPGFSGSGRDSDGAIMIEYWRNNGFGPATIYTQKELSNVAAEDLDGFGYALAVLPPTYPTHFTTYAPMILR